MLSSTGQDAEGCGEVQALTASADSYGFIQCYISSQKGPGVWLTEQNFFLTLLVLSVQMAPLAYKSKIHA